MTIDKFKEMTDKLEDIHIPEEDYYRSLDIINAKVKKREEENLIREANAKIRGAGVIVR